MKTAPTQTSFSRLQKRPGNVSEPTLVRPAFVAANFRIIPSLGCRVVAYSDAPCQMIFRLYLVSRQKKNRSKKVLIALFGKVIDAIDRARRTLISDQQQRFLDSDSQRGIMKPNFSVSGLA